MEDHVKLVRQVLDRLEQHDLAVLLNKSVFPQDEVELLGYIVKTSGGTWVIAQSKALKTGLTRDRVKKSKSSLNSQTSIKDSWKISRKFANQ